MATVEDLDDDSLRAVLVRVPLVDFVRNIKPVSRRFRQGNELAFKAKIEREPIEFAFCGECRHNEMSQTFPNWPLKPSQVFIADVKVPLAKLGDLSSSSLVPHVSKVILADAYCETLSGLRPVLQAILDKIAPGAEIQLEPCQPGHYDNAISGDTYRARLQLRGPLRQVAFSAADLVRSTKSLSICGPMLDHVVFSRGDAKDFAQLLSFTEQLTSLHIPACFYSFATGCARAMANLDKLTVDGYHGNGELSCQDTLFMIFGTCTNLTQLIYDCKLCEQSYSRIMCSIQSSVASRIPLHKLTALRSLSLRVGRMFLDDAGASRAMPAVEFLNWSILAHSAQDFGSVLQEAPSLKVLELDASGRLLAQGAEASYYEVIRDLLLTGQHLKQLTTVRVNASENEESDCYTDIRHLTEMPLRAPLRRIELLEMKGAVILGSPPKRKRRPDEPSSSLDLARCIRQASNIVEFRLCVDWRKDGYARLGELFDAMQYGSVLQLNLLADWMKIDRAAVAKVLPLGYEIHEWNVEVEGSASRFDSAIIRGNKKCEDLAGKMFWIRLTQFIPVEAD